MSPALTETLTRLQGVFHPAAVLEAALERLPGVFVAVLVLLVFWGLAKFTDRVLRAALDRARLDQTAASFIRTLTRFTITVVAALTALSELGIDTTSILASLGVMGLTFGFAAQDTLANVISGLFIFWDRPFVLGDLVELDGEYGRVEEITLRSTRLVTPDGRMFAIPNRVVAGVKVASYTNFPTLRLDIDVTVGVGEDLSRVRALLLGLVSPERGFMATPAPAVCVMALNDYNVALQLRAWIEDERTHIVARADLREAVFNLLTAEGVDMPFETLQIHNLKAG